MRLPTEVKEIRLHADLAPAISAMLRAYRGKARDAADAAVLQVLRSGLIGVHRELLEAYAKAIAQATSDSETEVLRRAG